MHNFLVLIGGIICYMGERVKTANGPNEYVSGWNNSQIEHAVRDGQITMGFLFQFGWGPMDPFSKSIAKPSWNIGF